MSEIPAPVFNTVVEVDLPEGTKSLRSGVRPEWNDRRGRTLHILSASNPAYRRLSDADNAARHARLLKVLERIATVEVAHALGRSSDNAWHERSVAVWGLSSREAIALGRRFGQAAVFSVEADHGLRVLNCDTATGRAWAEASDAALVALSTQRLVAVLCAARAAGDKETAHRALGVLVFNHHETIRRAVRRNVPSADVDHVAGEVVAAAVGSRFDGESVGQFVSWCKTITRRRIAEYHAATAKNPRYVSIDRQDEGDEAAGIELAVDGGQSAIHVQDAIDQALAMLSPAHRDVVDLVIIADQPGSAAVSSMAGMTTANVHKICSRFRRDVAQALA
jgi:RNA polymerase sigma factor (sigma-70 family)